MNPTGQNILMRVLSPKQHIKNTLKNIFKHPKSRSKNGKEIDQELSVNQELNMKEEEKQKIQCNVCMNNMKECVICKKENKISLESNFAKFVSSIMDYKMGKNDGQIGISKINNGKQSIFTQQPISPYKIQNTESKIKVCRSGIKFVEKSFISKKITLSCINSPTIMHQNIQCDGCKMFPLCGIRYKCKQCLDFDLCSSCFSKNTHSHNNFQSIAQCKQLQRKEKLRLNKNIHHQFKKFRGGIMSMVYNVKKFI